jgi:hypothetical protein
VAKPKRSNTTAAAKAARRSKRKQAAGVSDSGYRPGTPLSTDQRREMTVDANSGLHG